MHGHCANCFSRNCKTPGCPLVDCEHGCGAVTHLCKMEEHENLCINKLVPCINAIYGCEALLPRRKLSVHLKHCPASLVVCKFAWERVDRNITSDDHRVYESSEKILGGNRGEKFEEDFFHSDMERIKESLGAEEMSKGLINARPGFYVNRNNDLRKMYGIGGSFCFTWKPTKDVPARVVSVSSSMCTCYITVEPSQQLHILLRCGETVRRDEFENHYRTQHDIIHNGLDDWLVHHCPLNEYGCNFNISRLLPTPEGLKLMYSKHMQKFAITEKVSNSENARQQQQRELAAYGYSDIPVDPISQLPTEVLHIIIRYLDSSSLFCLSMTSRFLRDACYDAVKGNMVQLVWQHKDSKWKDSRAWSYSRHVKLPFNWQFTNNDSAMNKHLQHCPYYTRAQHYGIQPWEGSPLVDCKHGCGAVTQRSDIEEHEKVCWNKIVPCINVIYGCEVSLPRHKMNVHLEHCSASVVLCKYSWERVDKNITSEITSDNHPADENGKNRGENFVEDFFNSDMEQIMDSLGAEERKKSLSLMVQPYSRPECFYVTDPDKLSHKLRTRLNNIYGKNVVECKVVSSSSSMCGFYITVGRSRQQLRIVLKCNETVRRDQFENHYKTQHSIIHCELGSWLVHHCPLYEYGCNFSISRLLPTPEGAKLTYSKHSQKFAIAEKEYLVIDSENSEEVHAARLKQQRKPTAYGYSDIPADPISQLPTKALHIIINYLDSSSLFCLSMTSRFLRDNCYKPVKGNMVELIWQHKDNKWRDSQAWSYSRHVKLPFNWQFTNSDSAMNKHLQHCPYYTRAQHYGIQPWEGSPLVDCKHGCGAVTQHSDIEDHKKVCLNKIVPCINAIYGCEVSLPRHKMNVHLEHCSASVVLCKYSWERVDRNITSEITSDNYHADENGKNRDENYVQDFFHSDMEQIMDSVGAEERSKSLNLMVQPHSRPECFYVTDPDKLSHKLRTQLNNIYGKNVVESKVVSSSSSMCCFYITVGRSRQQLHIVLKCNETVRRDQFENHYKTQHDIVHCELGGWLVHHCPLYEYGCNFSISRLLPTPEVSKLTYSKYSQKFAIAEKEFFVEKVVSLETVQGWYAARLQQQRELAAYGYGDIPVDPVSQLPTEVLHIIINYLDSSGLFCLSMTSRFLRDACHNAVKCNMVQLVWQHKDNEWRDSQTWSYSRHAEIPFNWQFTNNDSAMNKHIQHCPYYTRPQHDGIQPFKWLGKM